MIYHRKGSFQSLFVGSARQNGEKVTIKEYHLSSYHLHDDPVAVAMHEVAILSRLSYHSTIPQLKEVFVTNASVYLVRIILPYPIIILMMII